MYLVGALSKLEKTSVTDINNSRCLTCYFAFWTSALSDGAPLPNITTWNNLECFTDVVVA